MAYNGNFNHELCTGSEDEDGDDAAEQVVIHRKGRALKKSDDNGKSKEETKSSCCWGEVPQVGFKLCILLCLQFSVVFSYISVCLIGRARKWRYKAKPESLRRKLKCWFFLS